MNSNQINPVNILGIKIAPLTYQKTLEKIASFLAGGQKHYIATVNPEFIVITQKDEQFKEILQNSSLNTADGVGILWASKILAFPPPKKKSFVFKVVHSLRLIVYSLFASISIILYPRFIRSEIPERITGTDLLQKICGLASEKNYSVFLLGAKEGVGERAGKKLKEKFPPLSIAGTYTGNPEEKNDQAIVQMINEKNPQILFVAYGSPSQEKWISRNLQNLSSAKLAVGVGGAFDYLSGFVPRAPEFLQKIGLEWLFRFLLQPKRLKRIINATILFPYLVLKTKVKNIFSL